MIRPFPHEPARYFVRSASGEGEHLTDISTKECSCEDWHFRRARLLARDRLCKHLTAACLHYHTATHDTATHTHPEL